MGSVSGDYITPTLPHRIIGLVCLPQSQGDRFHEIRNLKLFFSDCPRLKVSLGTLKSAIVYIMELLVHLKYLEKLRGLKKVIVKNLKLDS